MRFLVTIFLMTLPFAARADSTYQVGFKAFTAFGDAVAIRVLALADPVHHRDLTSQCAAAICSGVPEGPYTYTVVLDETGRKVDGSAVVYRTNQVVVVDVGTAAADLDDSAFPNISGAVSHFSDASKLWIRLVQLYGDMSLAAKVNKDGSFVLDQVRPGNWMVLVFNDGNLIHAEPFVCKVTGNSSLKINLSGKEPLMKAQFAKPIAHQILPGE